MSMTDVVTLLTYLCSEKPRVLLLLALSILHLSYYIEPLQGSDPPHDRGGADGKRTHPLTQGSFDEMHLSD